MIRNVRVVVQPKASTSDVNKETLMTIARARKKTPVTPVIEIKGKNTTMGVSVEPTKGTVNSLIALLTASTGPSPPSRCKTMFSTTTIAVSTTRPLAAARLQGHHVEGLAHDLHH